jgi:hypothetical protein
MSAIPPGWVVQPDGSYSKPKTERDSERFPVSKMVASARPAKKRIRQDSKPLMNRLETEYWRILCEKYGDPFVKPQALRFKLANGLWYKPDFSVIQPWVAAKVICYEVKGPFAFRGGFENLKSAAFQWPQVKFILVWKENGIWQEQEILK